MAGKGIKRPKKVKDLQAKTLSVKQAKGVKGGFLKVSTGKHFPKVKINL